MANYRTINGAVWSRGVSRHIHCHISRAPGQRPMCNPAKGKFRDLQNSELPLAKPKHICPICLGKAWKMGLVEKEEEEEKDLSEITFNVMKEQSGIQFDVPNYIIMEDPGICSIIKVNVFSITLTIMPGKLRREGFETEDMDSFTTSTDQVVIVPAKDECKLFETKIVQMSDLYPTKDKAIEKLKSIL